MSEDNQQAVVDEPEAQPEAVAEESGARDEPSLEELLKEYEAPSEVETKQPAEPAAEQLSEVVNELKEWRETEKQRQFQQDMADAVKTVKGEFDTFDDVFVESWIDAQARKDQRLATAWAQRHADPHKYKRTLTQLHKEFAKTVESIPDRQATEDREAVAAAVTGASNKAPESPPANYGRLANNEFADKVEKEFGFRPL